MDAFFWFLWFFNGALAYFQVRREQRKGNGKWTRADRLFWLPACLLGGTLLLLILLLIELGMAIGKTEWAKREARW